MPQRLWGQESAHDARFLDSLFWVEFPQHGRVDSVSPLSQGVACRLAVTTHGLRQMLSFFWHTPFDGAVILPAFGKSYFYSSPASHRLRGLAILLSEGKWKVQFQL